MQKRHVKHPFGAVIDKNCRIIILGSVPSQKSVEGNFFYMHPMNRFWKVMSVLLDFDLYHADIKTRADVLLSHGIALYDSVEECDIWGSSDSKITSVIPADIPSLIKNSKIAHVFCNGNASYNFLCKFHPELMDVTTRLPSTSPANASYSLDRLIDEWKIILNYIR